MSVLKAGEICLQVKGLLKSQKVKKYGILYSKSPDSHPFMELYDSKADYDDYQHKDKKCDIKKIDLRHIKTITNQTQTTNKGKEYHLEIRTKKEKNYFLFNNEKDSQEWTRCLNLLADSADKNEETSTSSVTGYSDDGDECVTINAMYGGAQEVNRFEVDVDTTDLARLCNINGKRSLLVGPTTIAFENVSTRQIDYTFQIGWLRRFGKKETVFSFEVGRQCENGAGNIKCRTEAANYIHELMSKSSNSRGKTVTPSTQLGVEETQKKVKSIIEKQIVEKVEHEDHRISGPARHIGKRHPGLAEGPALIPLNVPSREPDEEVPVSNRDSHKRQSAKSVDAKISGGSVKHGPVSDNFAKELGGKIDPHSKDSVKIKEKDRDSKKKESDKKKEEKENKKKEEKEKKEKEEREKKEKKEKEKKQKEKTKKDEKKGKEKPAQPLPSKQAPGGLYEEVDILDLPNNQSKPPEPYRQGNLDIYDDPTSGTPDAPAEYSTPIKIKASHVPAEYTEVKIVKGNAWKNQGRGEDEELHSEDYSEIKRVRKEMDSAPPPLPEREYEEDEEEDLYNHVNLKSSHLKNGSRRETENIYGSASGTNVGPVKGPVLIPEADYDDSDSGESFQDDTYDTAEFDTYDKPTDLIKPNKAKEPISSYEEASPKPMPKRRVPEESLYDEVS